MMGMSVAYTILISTKKGDGYMPSSFLVDATTDALVALISRRGIPIISPTRISRNTVFFISTKLSSLVLKKNI